MSAGPLTGRRVVELASIGPVPAAGGLLAGLGADVLRVGRPADLAHPEGSDRLGRGRPMVAIDLKAERHKLVALLAEADVLIEGYRPGVMERLGLGPDDICAVNPRLVYGRMTGWGQEGPRARQAGHDINYIALTGALHAIGTGQGPPVVPLNLVGDFGGGMMLLVVGVLAALLEREISGRGQVVDAAMVDGASVLLTMVYRMLRAGEYVDQREANLFDGGFPWYAVYGCADGGYVAVGCIERPFYDEMVRILGLRDLPPRADRDQWPVLRARLAEAFRGRSRDAWAEAFAGTDACVTPVLSLAQAPEDPHLRARGTFVDVGHGLEPAAAPRFSRTPGGAMVAGGSAGSQTPEQLLARWGVRW